MKPAILISILNLVFFFTPIKFSNAQEKLSDKIIFIDSYYENASPVIWNAVGDTAIQLNFLYDYERGSANRQSTHINLKIEAEPGTLLNLILSGFRDIYNGNIKTSYGRSTEHFISCYFSEDYKIWTPVEATPVAGSTFDFQVKYKMKSGSVYLAKLPVYSLVHLNNFKQKIQENKWVKLIPVGKTVDKRPLEIIQIGSSGAKHNVLIRARSHPWEPGGNWVIEGLVYRFLQNAEQSEKWLNEFCFYILPMANKDGVFRGMTRFNVNGSDLNRGWGFEADSILTPENYYLEQFVKKLISAGNKPDFMIDFHNDNYGNIHVSKPKTGDLNYNRNLNKFYDLMKEKTWFSGSLQKVYTDDPERFSIGAGLYRRYNITGCVFELNGDWIERLNKIPNTKDWQKLGGDLNEVLFEYFQ